MYAGNLAEYASSDAIFNEACHPYTQRLLQAFPDIEEPGTELASIPGNPPRLDDLPPGCRFEPRCHVCQGMEICSQQNPKGKEILPGHRVACHLV
jgi:oligopeptide/dipeptide ABC transporter ATP-binding protein